MEGQSYRLRISYDGTDYLGFQVQPGKPTVQATIEDALWRLTGERQTIAYAGRTDTGVHALDQVIAVRLAKPMPGLLGGLNAHLPASIVAWHAEPVPPEFDPRRDAVSRRYRYRIENRPWPTPFGRRMAWHVRPTLDDGLMDAAAQALIGETDLAGFTEHSGVGLPSTVRRVTLARVERTGDLVRFEIEATSFLPHVVRNIVGTLVWIGRSRLAPQAIATILASRNRRRAGPAAPGHGLFLVAVRYSDEADNVERPDV